MISNTFLFAGILKNCLLLIFEEYIAALWGRTHYERPRSAINWRVNGCAVDAQVSTAWSAAHHQLYIEYEQMNNIRIKCRKTKQTQVDIRPTTVMAMIFSRLVYFRVWIKLKKKKNKNKKFSQFHLTKNMNYIMMMKRYFYPPFKFDWLYPCVCVFWFLYIKWSEILCNKIGKLNRKQLIPKHLYSQSALL